MRELTKSMFSVSWALSLLGMQQFASLFTTDSRSASSHCTNIFDRITEDAVQEFDESMKGIFRSGDKVQRRVVDLMFGGPAGRPHAAASAPTAPRSIPVIVRICARSCWSACSSMRPSCWSTKHQIDDAPLHLIARPENTLH